MLTTKQLYTFLTEWSHLTNYEVNSLIDIASKYLRTDLLLSNSSGIIIYKTFHVEKSIATIHPIEIPIIHCNKIYGRLLVFKTNLTINERILLEMLTGLITCHIEYPK